ncbi:RsmB/NOP family class I SAM-dependent RNA methyltransferase [Candidatus Gracilibacteria bacterium]|nr:RsmB/NOP family class I SAM-dependent RNA methyltransferase [Candidatus Gracilibacteria bacterium]
MKKILAEGLVKKLEEIHTKDELKTIEAGFKTEKRKPTFRINTLKANKDKTIENLLENGLKISKISYLKNGFTLDEGTEKDLWNTGAFKAGYIYMQGISSMIPPLLFDFDEDSSKTKLLDVTAAPGSKTSQLSMLMNNKGQIIACDNNEIRVDKLKFTIKRQGCTNVGVVKKNAVNLAKELKHQFEAAPEEYFDKILFDAPCSAEGRMNLNIEKTYAYWKEAIPKRNYKLQKDIISNAITMLKPGGELVYSTCTLSPEENEGLVHFVLSMFPEIELVDISANKILKKLETKKGLKFYGKNPYRKDIINTVRILPTSEYEGFYVAKFIKKAV